jgi:hypothetical protein
MSGVWKRKQGATSEAPADRAGISVEMEELAMK